MAGGARLRLMPQRAVFLPDEGMLLVADAHIGKASSFRRLGVPVPEATTDETLARLDSALQASGAQHLVFLGDLLHSSRWSAPATAEAVQRWRDRHPALKLTLVRGNHDRHAGDPPTDWRISCIGGPLRVGRLALDHHPEADPDPDTYVLAGHLHPAAIVGGRAGSRRRYGPKSADRLRLPCFHFGPRFGVLPAFGAFTGMHVMPQAPGDRIWVVAGDLVRALPSVDCPP